MISRYSTAPAWFEIPVSDVDRARHFYEDTLRVPVTEIAYLGTEFWLISGPDSGPLGSLVKATDAVLPISSTEIPLFIPAQATEILSKVDEAGGRVIDLEKESADGLCAHIADPDGNRLLVSLRS
jgi:predicted enzyme related to lactoylglutathione lyase